MLLRELPLPAREELAHEATFAAQGRRADLRAGCVAEVAGPVDFVAQVVVGVDHFY